ncbi:MAG TPA: peptidase M28 family protein [Flavobacteriales bacterium]|nr:peptidase M28 family protein [Flavobacteriales bacterium]
MKKTIIASLLVLGFSVPGEDDLVIRKIFDAALNEGHAYENLRDLCKNVGNRLTGSHGDTLAVLWSEKKLKEIGCENVLLQPFTTNHWVRGYGDYGKIVLENEEKAIQLLSLGSSVGTGDKGIRAKVIEIDSWDDLKSRGKKVEGKIVFYNRPMNPKNVNTFESYGQSVDQRSKGASEAAKYGAVAALVRSMTLANDHNAHTGNMNYEDGVKRIPGLAISTADADFLHEKLQSEKSLEIELYSYCKNLGTVETNNVMGEIRGSTFPDEIIVVGAHLDSWDVGEGAHDDGAGVVHAMEVLNLFRQIGYKPRHTIRCVLFMNEENGVGGGVTYARVAEEKGEKHIAAVESDAGGFTPRGFHVDGLDGKAQKAYSRLSSWSPLFTPYNLHYFKQSYAGTDIGPLKKNGTALFGLIPDSQRYFDYHHTMVDVFEAVNKRELELGCGSMASLVYLIDKYGIE